MFGDFNFKADFSSLLERAILTCTARWNPNKDNLSASRETSLAEE
jgi:hypothetical protein